jgi:hypothetical protein
MRQVLEPPYSSPYQALSWKEKARQLLAHGRTVTVSTNRVKLAYMLNEIGCQTTTTFNPTLDTTSAEAPPLPIAPTTSSRRSIHFLARLKI